MDLAQLAFDVNSKGILEATKNMQVMDATGQRLEKTGQRAGGLINRSMREAAGGFDTANKSGTGLVTSLGAVNKQTAGLTALFSRLGPLIGGLGFASVVSSANQYSKALNEVSTLVDTTTFDMQKLSDSALEQAGTFGSMPTNTVRAYYQAISAGADTAEKATDALTASNKLAIGGVTDVTIAVDGLTTVMNAYGGEAGSFTDISDAMFVAMKAGKTTIAELSANIGSLAPIAAQAGASFDEVLAATAALTKGGVSTSTAMNGLRAIMASVIKPTKEASDLAAKLGLEFNAASLQSQGFAGFMELVREKTGGSTEQMALLFGGVEALTPALALTGKAAGDFADVLDQMSDKAGETEEAFTKMSNSPGFQMSRIIASLNAEWLRLSSSLTTAAVPALKFIADNIGPAFALVETAISSTLDVWGKMIDVVARNIPWPDAAISAIGDAFQWIGEALGPVLPYLGEFVAVAAGIALAVNGVAAIGAAFGAVGAAISGLGAILLANPITLTVAAIGAAAYLIYDNWDGIKEWWGDIWLSVSGAASDALNFFEREFPLVFTVLETQVKAIGKVLEGDFAGVWVVIVESAENFGSELLNQFSQLGRYLYEIGAEIIKRLADGIVSGYRAVRESVTGALDTVTDTIGGAVDSVKELGSDTAEGFVNGISGWYSSVKDAATGLADSVTDTVSETLEIRSPSRVMMGLGEWVSEGFAIGIENSAGAVVDVIADLSEKGRAAFERIADGLYRQSLQLTEGNEALDRYDLAQKEVTGSAADWIIEERRKVAELEKSQQITAQVADEISRLDQAQELQTIAVTQGADAAERARLMLDGYSESQARNAVETANNMEFQREFHGALVDSIKNADSIKDAFENLGDWMKEWLKEKIAHFAANKIMTYIGLGGGGAGGIASGLGSLLGGGSAGGAGSVGSLLGNSSMGGLEIAGVSAGAAGAALGAGGIGYALGDALGAGSPEAMGVLSAVGMAVGGPLGAALGAALGSAFGGKTESVRSGIEVGYSGGAATGQSFVDKEKRKSLWRGTKRWTEYSELDSGVAEAIDGYFGNMNTTIVAQATALGVAGADDILEGFEVAVQRFTGENAEEELQQWLSESTRAAYQDAYQDLGPELQALVSDSVDMVNGPVEDIGILFRDLAVIADAVVPAMRTMGLNLSDNIQIATVSVAKLAEELGGTGPLMDRMSLFYEEFVPASVKAKEVVDLNAQAVYAWNEEIGRGGEAVSANTTALTQHIAGLDLSTDAGILAAAQLSVFTGGLETASGGIKVNNEALQQYIAGLDTSTAAGQAAYDSATAISESLSILGQRSSVTQEQFSLFTDALAATGESGQLYLDSLYYVSQGYDEATGTVGINAEMLAVWMDTIDRTTASGEASYQAMLQLSESLETSQFSTQNAISGLDQYIGSLDLSTESGIRALEQVQAFATGIDESTGAITFNREALDTYIASLNTNTEAGAAAHASAVALAESLGVVDGSAITTREQMYEYIASLDLTTEAGIASAASALQQLEAIIALEDGRKAAIATMNTVNETMAGLNIRFDETSPKALGAADGLVSLMGGIDAFTAKTQSYYEMFYSEAEQANVALATAAGEVSAFNSGLSDAELAAIGVTDGIIDTVAEMRLYTDSLDLQTAAGQQAFAAAMEVAESMKAIADSGKSLTEVVAGLPEEVDEVFTLAASNMSDFIADLGAANEEITSTSADTAAAVQAAYTVVNEAATQSAETMTDTGATITAASEVITESTRAANDSLTVLTDGVSAFSDASVALSDNVAVLPENTKAAFELISEQSVATAEMFTASAGDIDLSTKAANKSLEGLDGSITGTGTVVTEQSGVIDGATAVANSALASFGSAIHATAGAAASAAGVAAGAAGDASASARSASGYAGNAADAASTAAGAAYNASQAANSAAGAAYRASQAVPASAGAYATGLARVPYDNFPAWLHKDERILTAVEASRYNKLEAANDGSGPTVTSPIMATQSTTENNELRVLREELVALRKDSNASSQRMNNSLDAIASGTYQQVEHLEEVGRSNDRLSRALQ